MKMIGFYDYTVILTYLSLMSGTIGIMLCLNGMGHPYLGMFFLLFSGLCDTFDGKVARSKKDRTTQMKKFGIQIDSLSDLIAFGILPACIGIAMLRYIMYIPDLSGFTKYILTHYNLQAQIVLTAIAVLYVLAAMIRLAYFNVTEEQRQAHSSSRRKHYQGLPITSVALIIPIVYQLRRFFPEEFPYIYVAMLAVIAFLFVFDFKVFKPDKKCMLAFVVIGALIAVKMFLL